jgi:NADPH:quinone reductase-like Zn-dependent oxidoreductase
VTVLDDFSTGAEANLATLPVRIVRGSVTDAAAVDAALVGVDVRQFLGFEPERAVEHMDTLMGWVAAGRLKAPVGRSFVLEDFADALEFALTGKGLGKTIVTI